MLSLLDLCCGIGGWTAGFIDEGFECVGVDLHRYKKYPGKLIVCDVLDYAAKEYYDVIVASPPCGPFTDMNMNFNGKPFCRHGLDLVYACLYTIQRLNPRFWILENVANLAKYIGEPKHKIKNPTGRKWWYLWGNYPIPTLFDSMIEYRFPHESSGHIPEHAKIPYPMARAIARGIKASLS